MGAYGHSRFREAILGGATRNILGARGPPCLLGPLKPIPVRASEKRRAPGDLPGAGFLCFNLIAKDVCMRLAEEGGISRRHCHRQLLP